MSLITAPEGETVEYEVIDVPEEEQHNELNTVLSELGVDSMDDILLKIYRINEMGKEAHCFDTLPDGLQGIEDRLRDAYGKGDYAIKVFAPTPSGGKSVKKKVKLSIETPIEKEQPAIDNSSEDLKTVMSGMIQAMTQSQENMTNMFQKSQLESQIKMQDMMIQLMGNKKDEPSMLETIKLFKSLQPDQKDPLDMVKSMMEVTGAMKDMVEPESHTPLGELTNGLNSLVQLAVNTPAKPAQPPQPAQPGQPAQLPKPAQQQTNQSQQPQQGDDMNPIVKMELKKHLQFLIAKAREDKNPEVYAFLIIEETPPQFHAMIVEAIGENDQDALNKFAEMEPGIIEFSDWFIELAANIRDIFKQVAEEVQQNTLTEPGKSEDDKQNSEEKPDDNQSTAAEITDKSDA